MSQRHFGLSGVPFVQKLTRGPTPLFPELGTVGRSEAAGKLKTLSRFPRERPPRSKSLHHAAKRPRILVKGSLRNFAGNYNPVIAGCRDHTGLQLQQASECPNRAMSEEESITNYAHEHEHYSRDPGVYRARTRHVLLGSEVLVLFAPRHFSSPPECECAISLRCRQPRVDDNALA